MHTFYILRRTLFAPKPSYESQSTLVREICSVIQVKHSWVCSGLFFLAVFWNELRILSSKMTVWVCSSVFSLLSFSLYFRCFRICIHNYKTTTQLKSTEKVGIFQGYLCERVFVWICGCFSSVFETRRTRNRAKGTKGYRWDVGCFYNRPLSAVILLSTYDYS